MTKLLLTIFLSILGIAALPASYAVGEISNADIFNSPFINGPTIVGGTSTANAATATTLSANPAALNSINITGSETITALATPAAPSGTPSVTGGTVAASTTNYCSIVALDSTGTVTGTQSAAVTTTGTTSSIAWAGTPVAGAVSYQYWLSTTSATYTRYFASSTASFTQTTPASSGTAGTFPTGNSTGRLYTGSGTTGLIIQPFPTGGAVGIYLASLAPATSNYSIYIDPTNTQLNSASAMMFKIANNSILGITSTGASVTGVISATGILSTSNTTNSTSTGTGALTVAGGVGIAGALNIGGITSNNGYTRYTTAMLGSSADYWMGPYSNNFIINAPTGSGVLVSINNGNIAQFSSTGLAVTGAISSTGSFKVGAGGISISPTAPTIASGFGTSPTIAANNTGSMQVNIGTGGTASSGVLTFPAMTTAPICAISNPLTGAGAMTVVSNQTTTSITLTNYTIATDVALSWPASTILSILCLGL